jgi:hypothetical protein
MKHSYASSGDGEKCTCKVKSKSFFGLIHLQSGMHKVGCPKSTKIDQMWHQVFRHDV